MRHLFALVCFGLLSACSGGREQRSGSVDGGTEPKGETVGLTDSANLSITAMLNAYYQLKDALVDFDTALANQASATLAIAAEQVNTKDITDSSIAAALSNFSGSIASEAKALQMENGLPEKKRAFSMISENFYPLLETVRYNTTPVYHQMCPMAFNDNESAFWLSNSREIVNPYLGRKHPKYASGMLHCGEVKDSLNFAK